MVPVCTERWCTEANEATQTHCYNPVAPAYSVWAYYAHGRQHRCQEDPVTVPSGRLDKTTRLPKVVPASHGSAPSNRIWNNTNLRFPKQQIWLRTALCWGWCRRMVLCNLRVACQKRRRLEKWGFMQWWHPSVCLSVCLSPVRHTCWITSLTGPVVLVWTIRWWW